LKRKCRQNKNVKREGALILQAGAQKNKGSVSTRGGKGVKCAKQTGKRTINGRGKEKGKNVVGRS